MAILAPRVGVAIALACVAFFLLPQPKPRYKPGEAPTEAEVSNEQVDPEDADPAATDRQVRPVPNWRSPASPSPGSM